ncbi:conserved hypothetical protein [Treponema phagedenis]|uniref:Uncharacterized protein n=1 Tax=Treponema phagedenis TaxID=162 RepID=A0A0B7H0H4_TREPH|nr:conserved hypothetical protein [Treponema phagedenis]
MVIYFYFANEQFIIGMLNLQTTIANAPITNSNLITKRYTN